MSFNRAQCLLEVNLQQTDLTILSSLKLSHEPLHLSQGLYERFVLEEGERVKIPLYLYLSK